MQLEKVYYRDLLLYKGNISSLELGNIVIYSN